MTRRQWRCTSQRKLPPHPGDCSDAVELLRRTEKALYRVK